jgi:uncharacterized protein (TIRG00374 family)
MSNAAGQQLWRAALPRIVVSLALAGGFVWLLMRGGLPLMPPRSALARLPLWALASHVLLMALVAFLRTYRWNYLIRPIAPTAPPLRVLGISMVGFSAVFLLPLRSGEVVRPYLLARDGEVSWMQAAGTVAAERVIDGLILTSFTFVALVLATPVSPLPTALGDIPLPVSAVPAAVYSALLLFTAAFGLMTVFYIARKPARRTTELLIGIVSKRAAEWAASRLERLADGLRFLPSKKNLLPFLGATVGCWTLTVAAQWVLLQSLGLDATAAQATTIVGVQALGSLAPAGPGMFGAFQIAAFSALAMYFPTSHVKLEGAVFIFVTYTAALALNSVQFLIGFFLMSRVPARPRL